MKKYTILVIILIGILALIVINRAYAPHTANQIPSDWQTYENVVSGLSVRVPADFIATTTDTTYIFTIPTTAPYAQTHLLREAQITFDTPVQTCTANDLVATWATTTIAQHEFSVGNWSDVGAGNLYQGTDYITQHNGLCYRISLFTHSTNGEGFYTDNPQQIAQINAQQKEDISALQMLVQDVLKTLYFKP